MTPEKDVPLEFLGEKSFDDEETVKNR